MRDIVRFWNNTRREITKSDLINALAARMDLSTREAKAIVDTLLETMTNVLANGDDIQIRGFGSFTVKDYGAFEGRNPKSGEKFEVKPKKLPFFKVGQELRERVNEGK